MKLKQKKTVAKQIIDGLKEAVESLRAGASIEQTFTCRHVDVVIDEAASDPQVAKQTRKLLKASQAVFAKLLGVSVQTVRAWEQGANVPSDMAKRFLDEIRHDPEYWRGRLRDLAVVKKRASPSKSK